MADKLDVPPGTLDMLILQTLELEPMHGLGISRRIERITRGGFQLNPGTFFPALYRLEQDGLVQGQWGRSDSNRKARFYSLTPSGRRRLRKELQHWRRLTETINSILDAVREG
jgi:transcriptional regulator